MAEGARLESVCTPKAYRGFESLSLRQTERRTEQDMDRFAGPEPCALRSGELRQARKGATVSESSQVPQVTLGPINFPKRSEGKLPSVALAKEGRFRSADNRPTKSASERRFGDSV